MATANKTMSRFNTSDTIRYVVYLTTTILTGLFLFGMIGSFPVGTLYLPWLLLVVWLGIFIFFGPPKLFARLLAAFLFTVSSIVVGATLATGVPIAGEQLEFAYLYRFDLVTGLSLLPEIPLAAWFVYGGVLGLVLVGPGGLRLQQLMPTCGVVLLTSGYLFFINPKNVPLNNPTKLKTHQPAQILPALIETTPKAKAPLTVTNFRHLVVVVMEGVRFDTFNQELKTIGGIGLPVLRPNPFFVTMPFTNAGWYSLLHGIYPQRGRHTIYDPNKPGLIGAFQKRGYSCTLFHSTFSYKFPPSQVLAKQGCDLYYGDSPRPNQPQPAAFHWGIDDGVTADRFVELIAQAEKPGLYFLGMSNTHFDYFVKPKETIYPVETGFDRYRNSVLYTVKVIKGLVKSVLKANPKTLLVVVSDHGESFGEAGFRLHGYSLHDVEIRVPVLIIGNELPALISRKFYSILDIFPTVADYFFGQTPAGVNGHSWLRPNAPDRLFLRSWWQSGHWGVLDSQGKTIQQTQTDVFTRYSLIGDKLIESFTDPELLPVIENAFAGQPD